jgi:hypothetical protein
MGYKSKAKQGEGNVTGNEAALIKDMRIGRYSGRPTNGGPEIEKPCG